MDAVTEMSRESGLGQIVAPVITSRVFRRFIRFITETEDIPRSLAMSFCLVQVPKKLISKFESSNVLLRKRFNFLAQRKIN